MLISSELSEERLSRLMAKRLEAEMELPPIPQNVIALHEAGFLPSQIVHRTGLSRVDVERFVKRLAPLETPRYDCYHNAG